MIADADCMEVSFLIFFLSLAKDFCGHLLESQQEAEINISLLLVLRISGKLQDGVILPIDS